MSLPVGGMAGALANPLYDDATLRLTPREHFSAPTADLPVRNSAVAAAAAAAQLPGKAAAARAVVPARAAAGQLPRVDEASSVLTAYAPGGLSVLYENQTMRVERVELKAELKLISARVRSLTASQNFFLFLNFIYNMSNCQHISVLGAVHSVLLPHDKH